MLHASKRARVVQVSDQMARLQLSLLGVLLLVASSSPAAATDTQSLGDLAATGLPEVRPIAEPLAHGPCLWCLSEFLGT